MTVLDNRDVQGILGKEVRSASDENMGRIVDIIVDRTGHVRAAVVDFGGFLGVGSRKIAISWNALRFPANGNNVVTLEWTRDQVRETPEYKDDKPFVMLEAASDPADSVFGKTTTRGTQFVRQNPGAPVDTLRVIAEEERMPPRPKPRIRISLSLTFERGLADLQVSMDRYHSLQFGYRVVNVAVFASPGARTAYPSDFYSGTKRCIFGRLFHQPDRQPMQIPLQINCEHTELSEAVRTAIEHEVGRLEAFEHHITGCRVAVAAPSAKHRHGAVYRINIWITISAPREHRRQPSAFR